MRLLKWTLALHLVVLLKRPNLLLLLERLWKFLLLPRPRRLLRSDGKGVAGVRRLAPGRQQRPMSPVGQCWRRKRSRALAPIQMQMPMQLSLGLSVPLVQHQRQEGDLEEKSRLPRKTNGNPLLQERWRTSRLRRMTLAWKLTMCKWLRLAVPQKMRLGPGSCQQQSRATTTTMLRRTRRRVRALRSGSPRRWHSQESQARRQKTTSQRLAIVRRRQACLTSVQRRRRKWLLEAQKKQKKEENMMMREVQMATSPRLPKQRTRDVRQAKLLCRTALQRTKGLWTRKPQEKCPKRPPRKKRRRLMLNQQLLLLLRARVRAGRGHGMVLEWRMIFRRSANSSKLSTRGAIATSWTRSTLC
jgi:hypothetical protein